MKIYHHGFGVLLSKETVFTIGTNAFVGCENLTSISLPDGLNGAIGRGAFAGCKCLTDFVVPKGVDRIAERAF